jgi:hypothetical protein
MCANILQFQKHPYQLEERKTFNLVTYARVYETEDSHKAFSNPMGKLVYRN